MSAAKKVGAGISSIAKSIAKSVADTGSQTKTRQPQTCVNCGVYRFIDSGFTNPSNAGKVYIGKTINFDNRLTQHGARVTPGTFQKIAIMDGSTNIQLRLREQELINAEILLSGGVPYSTNINDILANRINAMSQSKYLAAKSFLDYIQEESEMSALR